MSAKRVLNQSIYALINIVSKASMIILQIFPCVDETSSHSKTAFHLDVAYLGYILLQSPGAFTVWSRDCSGFKIIPSPGVQTETEVYYSGNGISHGSMPTLATAPSTLLIVDSHGQHLATGFRKVNRHEHGKIFCEAEITMLFCNLNQYRSTSQTEFSISEFIHPIVVNYNFVFH